MLDDGSAVPAGVDGRCRGVQQRPRGVLVRQSEHLTGQIMAGVGRKTCRQHRQTRGHPVAGGHDGAARSEHRLGIDR
ncbi:hypothetical protein WU83_16950 [Mycobacterium nebraskense]|nr:hypothetical protein WU83_16950 [Mycobacterium nebraskense]